MFNVRRVVASPRRPKVFQRLIGGARASSASTVPTETDTRSRIVHCTTCDVGCCSAVASRSASPTANVAAGCRSRSRSCASQRASVPPSPTVRALPVSAQRAITPVASAKSSQGGMRSPRATRLVPTRRTRGRPQPHGWRSAQQHNSTLHLAPCPNSGVGTLLTVDC
eukprot:scaffold18145_cov35-Tisochrysis_lutea.AAC.8